MKYQKLIIIFLIFTEAFLISPCLEAKDEKNDRMMAAKRYAETSQIFSLWEKSIISIANKMPEAKRSDFISNMKKIVSIENIEKKAIDSMARYFTTEELNALADFYGSPVGKSIMKKFDAYIADVQVILREEMIKVIKEHKKNQ